MTREEQIRQASLEYTLKNLPMCIKGSVFSEEIEEMNRNHAFEEGAKWADEHPNLYNNEKYHTVKVSCLDELNRKANLYDEFLEKTCEWMRKQKCQEYSGGPFERVIPDFIIEQYKQAMEE